MNGAFDVRPLHMSPVTAWLAGRILPSVDMGNFSPVTVHMTNFSSVAEINKAGYFKSHHGIINREEVFIWDNFWPDYRDLGFCEG